MDDLQTKTKDREYSIRMATQATLSRTAATAKPPHPLYT